MWTEKGSNFRFLLLFYFGDNCPQTQLHISMSSVGESRLDHARQEHGCFAPSFMDGLAVSRRGMESALTGVDVYVFERLSAGDLNSTSANASDNVRAAC